jgi:hypothetical protein
MKSTIILFFSLSLLLPCHAQTEPVKDNSNVGITLSFPWINYYQYIDYDKKKTNRSFGFFGLGISGYYKKGKDKFSFNVSNTEDLSSPISTNKYSTTEIQTSIGCTYFELIYHKPIREELFAVAGLNFTNYNFRIESTLDSIKSYKKTDQTLGLSIGLEYRFNNYFSVAGMYRPALASFETDEKYRHLINIELRIDLDFKKKK